MSFPARIVASVISLSALVAIGINFRINLADGMSYPYSVWILLAYFTIITNGLMAILFGSIALGSAAFALPRILAGAGLSMALVGIIFALLLKNLRVLEGPAITADFLLHTSNPILVGSYWLVFVRKGHLSFSDVFLWAAYPMAYFSYALIRGGIGGFYPYPFLNVADRGFAAVLMTGAIIAIVFVTCGAAVVTLDRILGFGRIRENGADVT